MGYACPVCDTPHPDGEHLANHLAVTAVLHEAAHETWLDAHVADWETMNPGELGARVAKRADEIEFETVFDDTTPADPPNPNHPRHHSAIPDAFDAETQRIIQEARELTERSRDETQED